MYAEWCTDLSAERGKLERARDARAGHLAELHDAFNETLNAFQQVVTMHQNETGCEKRH